MTKLDPASAHLIAPSAEWIGAYVEAMRPAGAASTVLAQALANYLAEPHAGDGAYRQLWMVAETSVIGRVSLRLRIDMQRDALAGHIAYEVFRAFRGQGFGHRALALGIEALRRQSVGDLLLFCEDDNRASIRIIEAAGGTLEGIAPHPDFPCRMIRRYRIGEKLPRLSSAAPF